MASRLFLVFCGLVLTASTIVCAPIGTQTQAEKREIDRRAEKIKREERERTVRVQKHDEEMVYLENLRKRNISPELQEDLLEQFYRNQENKYNNKKRS